MEGPGGGKYVRHQDEDVRHRREVRRPTVIRPVERLELPSVTGDYPRFEDKREDKTPRKLRTMPVHRLLRTSLQHCRTLSGRSTVINRSAPEDRCELPPIRSCKLFQIAACYIEYWQASQDQKPIGRSLNTRGIIEGKSHRIVIRSKINYPTTRGWAGSKTARQQIDAIRGSRLNRLTGTYAIP
jgi:hypothetical protein